MNTHTDVLQGSLVQKRQDVDRVFEALDEKARARLQTSNHNLSSIPVAITFIQEQIEHFLNIIQRVPGVSFDAVGLDTVKDAYCDYVAARELLDSIAKHTSNAFNTPSTVDFDYKITLYQKDLNKLDKILVDNLWHFKNIKDYIKKATTIALPSNAQSRFNLLLNGGGGQIIEKSKLIENTTTPTPIKMSINMNIPNLPSIPSNHPRALSPSPIPSNDIAATSLDSYSNKSFISVEDLMEIFYKFQKNVLLIDFRPKFRYDIDHISLFPNVVNIDPISIKPDFIVQDVIDRSLLLSSMGDISLFANLAKYDLVIIMDQSSIHAKVAQDTMRFYGILHVKNDDPKYKLKRKPIILDGGFDEWTLFMNNSEKPQQPLQQSLQQAPVSPIMHNAMLNTASPLTNTPSFNNYVHTKPFISRSPSPTGYSLNKFAYANPNMIDQNLLFPLTRTRSPSPVRSVAPVIPPTIPPKLINTPLLQVSSLNTPMRSQSPTHSPIILSGLFNLGNSCYMNASLQCLIGTKELTNYLLKDTYQQYVARNSKLGSGGKLTNEYHNLSKLMWSNTVKRLATNPKTFKKIIGSINSSFDNCDQQDSAEFLHFILDTIHEDLNVCANKAALPAISDEDEAKREALPIRLASAIEWERYLESDYSTIVETFAGQYASRLECGTCHKTSTTYIPYNMLSIPVPNLRKNLNLYDCVDSFVSPELLTGDNAWKCPRCKEGIRTQKQLTITRLPNVLILHLERFSFVGSMMGGKFVKNGATINIPLKLSMKKYWPQVQTEQEREQLKRFPFRGQEPGDWAYRLYGIVRHYGTLDGGHYISEVMKDGRWVRFDDEKLKFSDTMGKYEEIDGSAYILFYEKI